MKKSIISAVAQICNMMQSNLNDYKEGFNDFGAFAESFEGWCEDGDIFFDKSSGLTEDEAKDAEDIMHKLSASVNNLMIEIRNEITK